MHSQKTGVAMLASLKLDEPKVVTEYKLQIDRKSIGKTFKAEQKKVRYTAHGDTDRHVGVWRTRVHTMILVNRFAVVNPFAWSMLVDRRCLSVNAPSQQQVRSFQQNRKCYFQVRR